MGDVAFAPDGGTIVVAATVTSSNTALPVGGDTILVYNSGTTIAFVKMTAFSTDTATSADVPVPPSGRMLLSCPVSENHVATIMATGTANLYFTRGFGTQY